MLSIEAAKLVVTEAEERGRLPLVVARSPQGSPESLDLERCDRLGQRGGERREAGHRRRID
jgi:hypothetical protein